MIQPPKFRLRAMAVPAGALAARLGVSADTVTRGLKGDGAAPYVAAAVDALEIMTPEQRAQWLGRSQAEP